MPASTGIPITCDRLAPLPLGARPRRAAYLARRLGTGLRDRRARPSACTQSQRRRAGGDRRSVRSAGSSAGSARRAAARHLGACAAALDLQLAAFFERCRRREPAAGHRAPSAAEPVIAVSAPGGWAGVPEASVDPGAVVAIHRRAPPARGEPRGGRRRDLGPAARRRRGHARPRVEGPGTPRTTRPGPGRSRGCSSSAARTAIARSSRSCASCSRRGTRRRPRAGYGPSRIPATPMPAAGGFAWTTVDGTRLIAARL